MGVGIMFIRRGRMVVSRRELDIGTRIERREHEFSIAVSRKIARDHIRKNPYYYSMDKKHFTSIKNGHKHFWKYNNKRTSIDDNHSHPINFKKMVAEKGRSDHIHKLLK